MKILIDVRLLTRATQTGIGEYTHLLVNELIDRFPQHAYELFYNGWRKDPLPSTWQSTPHVSIIDWRLPNKVFQAANIDISHYFSPNIVFSPHIDFLNHGRLARVMTIHDLSFVHYPNFFSRRYRLWHWLQRVRRQAQRANHIVTDSDYSKNDLAETLGLPLEKISVIYPGLDPQLSQQSIPRPPRLQSPFILYLGTIEPRKNIAALIKSFFILKASGRFPDLQLILAGRPGWLYQKVFRIAQESPHRKDVVFWGPVTAEEKLVLYNLAEVFVYPSFFEGFGFPPLEAQACGCPVVVAERTSLTEIVNDSALKVNPWRTDQLAEAIEFLLTNRRQRAVFIKRGLINHKRFSWNLCAAQLLSLLVCSAS